MFRDLRDCPAGVWAADAPLVALTLSIGTHFIATMPPFVRAFGGQESPAAYLGGAINATCTLLVLDSARMIDWIFPAYLFGFCLLMAVITVVARRTKTSASRPPVQRRQQAAVSSIDGSTQVRRVPI